GTLALVGTSGNNVSELSLGPGGTLVSPGTMSLTTTQGNLGNQTTPLALASSLSAPGTVNLVARAGGIAWLADSLANDTVAFNNATTATSAGTAFSLVTAGNIIANISGSPAVISPIVSLTAIGGNIGGDSTATTPLLVNGGGSGLSLFVNA